MTYLKLSTAYHKLKDFQGYSDYCYSKLFREKISG